MPVPVVVTGVSGSGKTTIGGALAERLGVPYAEADSFHPPANVAKMARGEPLDDADREPWLAAIADRLAAAGHTGLVVSCSALRRRYRDRLRQGAPDAWFVHLALDSEAAERRVAARTGHYFGPTLVASQFAALEPLAADEHGCTVDATAPAEAIVAAVLAGLPG
jgi:gluconokinase